MEALFKQYAAAWDAFNPKAIADLYLLPCAIVDSDGVQVLCISSNLIGYLAIKSYYMNRHQFMSI
ncbi:hypothetical protein [Pseudoalteromonas 'SMAR']|uniref:hypothetical protein n=1 Tax=Pseudoalteromonas 'SMAR' TaxID=3416908 RepID=UPI003AF2391F